MSKISQKTRQEITSAVAARYREGTRREKTVILDEFVRITGYHRKHAIRLLRGGGAESVAAAARSAKRVYDEAVRQALVVFWEASDRICGKRLKPLLPLLMKSLSQHGHLEFDDEIGAWEVGEPHSKLERPSRGRRHFGHASNTKRVDSAGATSTTAPGTSMCS